MSNTTIGTTITRVQTGSGKLTVTADSISIERPSFPRPKTETIRRAAIVGVDSKVTVKPGIFTKGAMHLTLHVQGSRDMDIKAVPYPIGQSLLAMLGYA